MFFDMVNPMKVSNTMFYNFLSEALDRYSRADDDQKKHLVSVEIENTLRLLNDLRGEPDEQGGTASGSVVWALDPQNAVWTAAGLNAAQRAEWEVFGQAPALAGEWVKMGVSPGLACLLRTNKVTPQLYRLWVEFYGVDASTNENDRKVFHQEILDFLGDSSVTPSQSKTWIAAGIALRDVPRWKRLGHTAATAKKELEKGVVLAELTDESPVPGTSYRKVAKVAQENGWVMGQVQVRAFRYYAVELTKDDSKVKVQFSQTGRLSSIYASGKVAEVMNARDPRPYSYTHPYFHGRSYKTLEEVLTSATK
jgi:hypothetical protein